MTIGEIAERLQISTYTLRYYEEKGLLRVPRDDGGRRCYEANDIAWIQFIKRLKDTGMQLRDIKTYAELRYQGDSTMKERLAILETHRLYLLEEQKRWEEYLQNVEDKISFYKGAIARQ